MSEVKVVIKGDLIIDDTAVLDSLVQIVIGCGAEINIAPVVTEAPKGPTKRRSSAPKAKQEKPKVEEKPKVDETPKVEKEKPKVEKEEKPKAKKEEKPAEVKPDPEPETVAADTGEVNQDELMDKFTSLIDKDYDAALNLLQEYGVNTFHDLQESEYPVFYKKVDELLGAGA